MGKSRILLSLVIATSAVGVAAAAPAYESLLDAAVSRDRALSGLAVAEERATIALNRAILARDGPRVAAGSGESGVALSISEAGAAVSASPSASLTLPTGPTFAFGLPFALAPGGSHARPGLGVGLPLIRGPDEAALAVERAASALDRARAALSRRRLEIEKGLVRALKAAFSAEIEVKAAEGAAAKARRELERAVRVDGAEPGGISHMNLDRDLRAAARSLRDKETARDQALESLALMIGAPARVASGELLPESFPEPDLGIALPDPASLAGTREARATARLASLESDEAARRTKLDATLDASYGLRGGSDVAVEAGLGISAGIAAELEDWKLGASLGYGPSGPSLGLSAAWKPAPRGDRALRERDEALAAAASAAEVETADETARAELRALEAERGRLVAQAEDAAQDLAFALGQAAIYGRLRDAGLAAEADYEEVVATAGECAARAKAAQLDRALWAIDLRLIAGETR